MLTGLALTLALLAFVVAGAVRSRLFALAVRRSELLSGIDASAADWAHHHTTARTHRMLEAVTNLASTPAVIVIARHRRRDRVVPRAQPAGCRCSCWW